MCEDKAKTKSKPSHVQYIWLPPCGAGAPCISLSAFGFENVKWVVFSLIALAPFAVYFTFTMMIRWHGSISSESDDIHAVANC